MEEWKTTTLSEVIKLIGGGTPKTTESEYWNGEIPWLSVVDFNDDKRKVYSTEKHITKLGLNNSSTKLLAKDDIIVSARGTVGAIAQLGKPMAFNQSCYGIRNKENVNIDFLYYLLKTKINELKQKSHGSVFSTITRDTFDNIDIKLPPLEPQKQIAQILSSIDDKIELNNKINDNLEKQAQAIFKSWFVDFEPFGGVMPADWDSCICSDLFYHIKPGTNFQPTRTEQGIPFLNVRNISSGSLDITSVKYITSKDYAKVHKSWQPEKNDVLISRIGTLGLVAVLSERHLPVAVHYNFINIKSDLLPSGFIYFLLKSEMFQQKYREIIKQSVQEYVTIDDVSNICIDFPKSIDSVLFIVNTLDKMYSSIDKNFEENQKLAQLRDTLLPRLMSGEIDVSQVEI